MNPVKSALHLSLDLAYTIVRGRERLTVAKSCWGKSPHPPSTQPYTSMGGESHGNGTETTRPVLSDDATEPCGEKRECVSNSLSAGTGYDETANPCGCKPEQGRWIARYPPGYGA